MVFTQLLPWREAGTEREFRSHCVHRQPPPFQGPEGSQVRPGPRARTRSRTFSALQTGGQFVISEKILSLSLAVIFRVCSQGQLRGRVTGPQAQKSPMLVLMLYCHCLEILNFWTRALHFHFAPGVANCLASSVCSNKTKHFPPFSLVLFFFLWGLHFKYIVQSLARNVPIPGQHPHFSHVASS